ncbi:hypothetical protein QQ045_014383 [Rhodiola kirilowii]
MSDSHIYELDDIVWDDFSISDDHLVPHPKIAQNEASVVLTGSHKKLKSDVGMTSSTCTLGTEHVNLAIERTSFSSPKIKSEQMLGNSSLSHNPDAFPSYDDLMTSLPYEGANITRGVLVSNNNLCTGDPHPGNNCNTAENNISYSLSDAPHSESDHSFLYNGLENKETGDTLFYEWPEIGNFEDVDQMLRTCDSAFGLGDSGKEDDMCWFSSPTAINGLDAASKSEVRSSYSDSSSIKILSKDNESAQTNYENPAVDVFHKSNAGASYTSNYLASNTIDQSCLSKASSINMLPTSLDIIDSEKPLKKVVDFTSSDPVSARKKSLNSQNEMSSNLNSQSDVVSLETSFRQLQEVMEQLDLKTKLCIRDSLYRLARSADQRQGAATIHHVSDADTNSSDEIHAGLLDIETDTNPIDRAIAHLLFHRPTDPSKMPLSSSTSTWLDHSVNYGVEDMVSQDDFKDAKLAVAKKE